MPRIVYLLAPLLVLPVFGSDSPKEYDDGIEYHDIEGAWRRVDLQYQGKSDRNCQMLLTFHSGGYTVGFKPNAIAIRGSYRIDTIHQPPHIDLIEPSSDQQTVTLMYIYWIKADTLKLARIAGVGNQKRPTRFDDDYVVIETYKRVK
jgi:uncharacterized protein (TIGR03067 family)